MKRFAISWMFGLFLLAVGCSATASKSGETLGDEKVSTETAHLRESAKANNDLERLAALWEERKKESKNSDCRVGLDAVVQPHVELAHRTLQLIVLGADHRRAIDVARRSDLPCYCLQRNSFG